MGTEPANPGEIDHLLDRLVRRERGRLIAGLAKRLGHQHLALAEDVAQEAVLKALAVWPYRPLPDDPAAWLSRVAMNRAIDRLRREGREFSVSPEVAAEVPASAESLGRRDPDRADPELELMFLACHPVLGPLDRVALTLRVVCGFTARELAEIFLRSQAAIGQRLSRSKRKLAALGPERLREPRAESLVGRLPDLQKSLYLMFGLGYAPRSGASLIRRDVAFESLRLAESLVEHLADSTAAPARAEQSSASALAALLCFQASRFDARETKDRRLVLLRDQDRARWDHALIDRGLGHLARAGSGQHVSRYHVEAGIAACYATAPSWEAIDWDQILALYRSLEHMTGSPVVQINASVALAFAGQPGAALEQLEAIVIGPELTGYAPFHVARAEILRLLDRAPEARRCYAQAIAIGASAPVLAHLEHRLATSL